jgi:hypothetical protein
MNFALFVVHEVRVRSILMSGPVLCVLRTTARPFSAIARRAQPQHRFAAGTRIRCTPHPPNSGRVRDHVPNRDLLLPRWHLLTATQSTPAQLPHGGRLYPLSMWPPVFQHVLLTSWLDRFMVSSKSKGPQVTTRHARPPRTCNGTDCMDRLTVQ